MDIPYYRTGEHPEILVILDNRKDDVLKQFRCPVCGKIVFEYFNSLKIIMSGSLDSEEIIKRCKSPIVVECKGFVKIMGSGRDKFAACKARFWVE